MKTMVNLSEIIFWVSIGAVGIITLARWLHPAVFPNYSVPLFIFIAFAAAIIFLKVRT